MGKFFTNNTWSAPLRLIDCWLPEPRMQHGTRQACAGSVNPPSSSVQRFTRAGWLGRHAANAPKLHNTAGDATPEDGLRVRVLGRMDDMRRPEARVVISGRIGDVCDELDRLARMESERLVRAA